MTKRNTNTVKLAGTLAAFCTLAGCGNLPTTSHTAGVAPTTGMITTPARTTMSAEAVPGKVIVKLRNTASTMSVQSLMKAQSIQGLSNTKVYTVPSGSSVDETLAKLRKDPNVAYAEPDYLYHATGLHTEATVNDPKFNQLWGIQKIQAPAAWDTTTGDSKVVVAVVDTGVDYNHPDLQGQVIKGPNLVSNTSDPMDDQGHGSHVAGTIAAVGDNGVGVVGIAYHTKVLAIKVLGSDGSGDTATIAQGILKAQELGAKVINMSLGGPQDSQALHDAVTQVTQKGTLCVVAAGNDGTTGNDYPAAYPESLAVGATDQNDARTSFSNYGADVAIAAPGLNILSTTGGDYKQESGTSMASPHVAGAAALLLAKNPNLTPDQIKGYLTQNGDPASGGFPSGVQRLNVAKALAALTGGKAPTTNPTPAPSQPSQPDPQQPSPQQPQQPQQPGMNPGYPQPGMPAPGMNPGPGYQQPGPGYYPQPGMNPGPGDQQPGMNPGPGYQQPGPGYYPQPGMAPQPGFGRMPRFRPGRGGRR